jgi:hypothetical protein
LSKKIYILCLQIYSHVQQGDDFMNRRELLRKKLVTMTLTGVLLSLLSLSPSASLPQATEEDVALGAAGAVEE